jgi:hypothetical protein
VGSWGWASRLLSLFEGTPHGHHQSAPKDWVGRFQGGDLCFSAEHARLPEEDIVVFVFAQPEYLIVDLDAYFRTVLAPHRSERNLVPLCRVDFQIEYAETLTASSSRKCWRFGTLPDRFGETGAGGGNRTHAMPGWKPGVFPLGDARSKGGPGSGSRTHGLAIIDRALCQTELSLVTKFELVPGAGVEPA